MAPVFSYEPLPARFIRVIKLLPASRPTDALRCSVKHADLDRVAAQPYETLSYVWGEPTRRWPLDCNGKELLVTKNCHEALVNLRSRFFPRTLWIDAICINQAGTDEATAERNGQVAMMGEIYLKATRVLIWLGAPAQDATTSCLAMSDQGSGALKICKRHCKIGVATGMAPEYCRVEYPLENAVTHPLQSAASSRQMVRRDTNSGQFVRREGRLNC
ncbi:hypothetical protein N657DRAFT_664174 [Parathielavia appendiculata]|uniref:Heterokaryon incompatibility domain-containing protein n=1 Tax=Parathielavia appendiculata TaxID=2587402 RepID=A0AAN6TYF3_9PEZI|nr:hypothetical protein N657DRAFT_664174 [Parathielavia appendiculata]